MKCFLLTHLSIIKESYRVYVHFPHHGALMKLLGSVSPPLFFALSLFPSFPFSFFPLFYVTRPFLIAFLAFSPAYMLCSIKAVLVIKMQHMEAIENSVCNRVKTEKWMFIIEELFKNNDYVM